MVTTTFWFIDNNLHTAFTRIHHSALLSDSALMVFANTLQSLSDAKLYKISMRQNFIDDNPPSPSQQSEVTNLGIFAYRNPNVYENGYYSCVVPSSNPILLGLPSDTIRVSREGLSPSAIALCDAVPIAINLDGYTIDAVGFWRV